MTAPLARDVAASGGQGRQLGDVTGPIDVTAFIVLAMPKMLITRFKL